MKKVFAYSIFLTLLVTIFSCKNKKIENSKNENIKNNEKLKIKEPNDSSKYFSLNKDYFVQLFKDNKGNIYRKRICFIGDRDVNKTKYDFSVYYDSIFTIYDKENNPVETSLRKVIDISTFKNIDDSFYYKDKNHIYYFHPNSDGGGFYIIENADSETFKVFDKKNFDAKDKNHKYYQGSLL